MRIGAIGGGVMQVHWQNLNERGGRNGTPVETGSPWRHGRAWLHYGQRLSGYPGTRALRVEWSFGRAWDRAWGLGLDLDAGEGDVTLGVNLGPLAGVYLSHTMPGWVRRLLPRHVYDYRTPDNPKGSHGSYPEDREISLKIHDQALWWSFWNSPHEWSSQTPRWRHGSWHWWDTVLGRTRCNVCVLGGDGVWHPYEAVRIDGGLSMLVDPPGAHRLITIPMPEGVYPATIKTERRIWTRPRWPWWPLRMERVSHMIDCDIGVPFPGKGENSWDCGEDSLHGAGADGSEADAIGRFVASVLDNRRRYGGTRCAEEPWPESPTDRLARLTAMRAANAATTANAACSETGGAAC